MYIYFLPINQGKTLSKLGFPTASEAIIPTSDGGIEHTAALFAPCSEWLSQAARNEIILFPPQLYLIYLLSHFLQAPQSTMALSSEELQGQRDAVLEFLQTDGDGNGIKWADKVMSPTGLPIQTEDGRSVLALDKPGPELSGSGRRGDEKRVILVKFGKQGPRDVQVRLRKEILDEDKRVKDAKL